MFKKIFALASVTTLMGVISTATVAGCSDDALISEISEAQVLDGGTSSEGGKDASKPKPPDAAGGDEEPDEAQLPEEGTVGKECKNDTECNKPGSKNDNFCSDGTGLFPKPVCIQAQCTRGDKTPEGRFACDGSNAGFCVENGTGANKGECLPGCKFTSTRIIKGCASKSACNVGAVGKNSDGAEALGFCLGACQSDGDCRPAFPSCKTETGECTEPSDKFKKNVGVACKATPRPECNCNAVRGTGADKDKGYCTRQCVTGPEGDAECNKAVPGWTCTARLPAKDPQGNTEFTAQPDALAGVCALPCTTEGTTDMACMGLGVSTGLGALIKCKAYAGRNWCDTAKSF